MRTFRRQVRTAAALAALAATVIASSGAGAQADFYRGKTIELIISTGVGGGLDTNGRIVARHLGNHIPGHPTIVAKNMPGAGHIRAANYVFSQAPKDGTTIGTFIPIFVMAQVLGAQQEHPVQSRGLPTGWCRPRPATRRSMSGTPPA